ncbi:MAG TPA: hypothetical protein VLY20_04300 [Nitrospiria bacterium]|nr:hypothetical protein [Nitrospiria bacterium]HUK55859.1 hypothetical protein [Nitrospiria bacterium]
MNKILRPFTVRLGGGLLVFLLWSIGPSLAQGYAPIDDLIASVNQLVQSQDILNATVAQDLISTLQTIDALVDQGNRVAAGQLLTAFTQDVSSLSGDLITPAGVNQLVNKATATQSGL